MVHPVGAAGERILPSGDMPAQAGISYDMTPKPISRRLLLGGGALAAAAALDAFAIEPRAVQLTRRRVAVPGLPAELDGIRIASVTDTHLPRNRAAVAETLDHLERERPDLIVLVGDLCDRRRGEADLAAFAGAVAALAPAAAVLGNWEYAGGLVQSGAVHRAYRRAGIPLLVNRSVRLPLRGSALELIGLDDLLEGRPDPEAAAAGADRGLPWIWMVHAPALVDRLTREIAGPAALLLAGHTHGGQVCLPTGPIYLPAGTGRYAAGAFDTTAGHLYVSRGVGTTGIPARFFCPPELPIFTLERA